MVDPERNDLEAEPSLPDKDFINESYGSDPGTLWIWLAFLAAFVAIIWGVGSQYAGYLNEKTQNKPFLQVTNREMSIFLWQYPQWMRANARTKSGYLPAFEYLETVAVNPKMADQNAIAPPELFFLYHTWDRLLHAEFTIRPIITHEFVQFLESDEQWQPENWPGAPPGYKELVKGLDPLSKDDMQKLPEISFPRSVRLAFQGWKDYHMEADQIDAVRPTYKEMAAFLEEHPHYGRSYWRNIVDSEQKQYLGGLSPASAASTDSIPTDQLAHFLKVAFFNAQQAKKDQ